MLSANNVLSPAHGRPLVTPTQDMIIGAFFLTEFAEDEPGAGRVFRHRYEIERSLEKGDLGLHAPIQYRNPEIADLIETPANGVAATCKPGLGRVRDHRRPDPSSRQRRRDRLS